MAKKKDWEWILWAIGIASGLTLIISISCAALSCNVTLAKFDWNKNFIPWILAALAAMATAFTGVIIYRQFKLDNRRFDFLVERPIGVNIKPIEETLNAVGCISNAGIKIILQIANPFGVRFLIAEIFIHFVNDTNKYDLHLRGDYRNFNFNNVIKIQSNYIFQGHFNIPQSFNDIELDRIMTDPFNLVVHFANRELDGEYVPHTEEINVHKFEPINNNEGVFDHFRVVSVFDPLLITKSLCREISDQKTLFSE